MLSMFQQNKPCGYVFKIVCCFGSKHYVRMVAGRIVGGDHFAFVGAFVNKLLNNRHGEYRGLVHGNFNRNYYRLRGNMLRITVLFHNLRGYDSHLII